MTAPDLQALAAEPLDPELEQWVESNTALGPWCKHPLVFGSTFLPGHLNRQLAYKKQRLAEAIEEKNWSLAMWLHERPYRLRKLHEWWADEEFGVETLRELLPEAWSDAEMPHQHHPIPLALFTATGFLTDAPGVWGALPDTLTIYRGDRARPSTKRGSLSWTLARGAAEFFARRFARQQDRPRLWRGTISKADALAYFEGRGEAEVVVSPRHVRDLTLHPMGAPS